MKKQPKFQSSFSNFHFAKNVSDEMEAQGGQKKNSLKDANALGAQYALDPTPERAEAILRAFHGFIMKYVHLMIPMPDRDLNTLITRDTIGFLRLFISKEDYSEKNKMATYRRIAERLPNMAIQSLMEPDDLYNELCILFLSIAQKFNPDIGGFTGYIQFHFKFHVKTRMFQIQNDAANYQPLHEIIFDDDNLENEVEGAPHPYELQEENVALEFGLPPLTADIVSSPPELYKKLWTRQQRYIIVEHFTKGKTLSVISNELGYSNATVVKADFKEAIEKISNHMKN